MRKCDGLAEEEAVGVDMVPEYTIAASDVANPNPSGALHLDHKQRLGYT